MKDFFFIQEKTLELTNNISLVQNDDDIVYGIFKQKKLFFIQNNNKEIINFQKETILTDNEKIIFVKKIIKNQYLMIINNGKFFLFEKEFNIKDIKNFQEVHFKFGKTLNIQNESHIQFMKLLEDQYLLIINKFIFRFQLNNKMFSLFKIFNSKVLDFCYLEENQELFVLTQNKIEKFGINTQKGVVKPNLLKSIQNQKFRNLVLFQNNVILLKDSTLYTWDLENNKIKEFLFVNGKKKEKTKIENILSIQNKILIVFNTNYLFVFDKKLNKMNQILWIKNCQFLIIGSQIKNLNSKQNNYGILKHIQYNEVNRNLLFYRQKNDDKLDIVVSYLIQKILKLKQIKNYNKTIHNLLCELHLNKQVLQHKQFQKKILELVDFIKDFTTYTKRHSKKSRQIVSPLIEIKHNLLIIPEIKEKEKQINEEKQIQQNSQSCENVQNIKISTFELKPIQIKQILKNFNKEEKWIIKYNMKKQIKISPNPIENAQIKFLRAQNRIIRIQAGKSYSLKIINNSSLSIKSKIAQLFYHFKKFQMKNSKRNLYIILNNFTINQSLYRLKDKQWEEFKQLYIKLFL